MCISRYHNIASTRLNWLRDRPIPRFRCAAPGVTNHLAPTGLLCNFYRYLLHVARVYLRASEPRDEGSKMRFESGVGASERRACAKPQAKAWGMDNPLKMSLGEAMLW